MRSSSLLLTVLLCIFILNSNAKKYKILMFSPKFAHSHVTYMGKIADTLVEAGHDVTVFLPEQSKNVKTNGTKLAKIIGMPAAPKVLKQFQGDVYFENTWTAGTQNPLGQKPLMSFVADTMAMQCEELMKHDEIFEYFKNENFDLGIVEIFDIRLL
ncbi:hypothetical protein L596_026871 [Steinernema carpocapsae]|uniref:glucuronosyltransferase n=1 Tax=Steinernema carpocapsae TaxID=34508 RepID=A0A4U5M2M2_STECR|nr:hypothetical protein L596_026871 [Steinernema carpocapsae]